MDTNFLHDLFHQLSEQPKLGHSHIQSIRKCGIKQLYPWFKRAACFEQAAVFGRAVD